MAEFNASAFSAVDSFFVIDKEGLQPPQNVAVKSGKTKRLGVGATVPTATSTSTKTSIATNRVLQVGKKKRKSRNDGEEEEEIEDDEEGEEELGRSAIATETTKGVTVATDDDETPLNKKKKKKKKSGKKERLKEKEQQVSPAEAEEVTPKDGNTDAPLTSVAAEETAAAEGKNNNKRKRRKVRSRQKNIYKDNRKLVERPDRLLPGGYEYRGRPMTAATRAKLDAKRLGPPPEPDADAFRASWDATDRELHDNGVPVLAAARELPRRAPLAANRKPKRKYKNIQ